MIPDGWRELLVGGACLIKNSLRFPINVGQRTSMQGVYPYIGPTGVLDHIDHYRIDEEFAVIGEDGDHFLKFRERPMTQLFSGKANVNNHAHIVADSELCSPRWFYYWFMHRDLTPALTRQGVGRYKLTKASLENLKIVVPPKNEQVAIANVLSAWERSIEMLGQSLVIADHSSKLLASLLLFGRRRLSAYSEWETKAIGELVSESRFVGSGGDKARKISVKLYGGGLVGKNEKRVGSSSTQYYRRSAGQFIYSKLDFLNGAFGLVPPELEGYESTLDLPAFDFIAPINPRWFLYYVSQERFYRGNLGLANGGRKARRVNPSDFLRIAIDVPERAEQDAIVEAIDTAVAEKKNLERQVELLRLQKQALMNDLLTGRRRLAAFRDGAAE